MSIAQYLAGTVWLVSVGACHVHSARRVQLAFLVRLSVPGRVLACAVLALMSLITLGQLLGAVGLLSWWPVLLASLASAVAVTLATRSALSDEAVDVVGVG